MTFVIDNWLLFLLALTSGAMLMLPTLQSAGASLTAAGAVRLINREKAVVVDVGDAEEYAQGHIAGARHIPLAQLEAQLPLAVKNKALPLVLVCHGGARARRAAAVAQKLGYAQAQALSGGMKGWKEASLPVVRV